MINLFAGFNTTPPPPTNPNSHGGGLKKITHLFARSPHMHLDSKKSNSQLYLVLARPKVHAHHPHHRPKVLQLLFGLGLERGQRFLLRNCRTKGGWFVTRRYVLLTSGSRASFYLQKTCSRNNQPFGRTESRGVDRLNFPPKR